ncbi:MAG: permease [Anaerolineae bacterium]
MASHIRNMRREATTRRDFGLIGLAAILWWVVFTNLQAFADFVTYTLLGLSADSHLGSALNFFVYDVPKILLLLGGMIFLITLLRTFITPEQTRRWLGGRREGVGNLLAAGIGVITPFCSCSAVPLFIGFVESGLPLGVTFSYLVAAPMVNEVALVMLFGMFGWQIAGLYLVSGLAIAVSAGIVIGRLHLEHYVEDFVYQVKVGSKGQRVDDRYTWHERFEQALSSTREIVGKVWLYVVIGIAIGALIHGFVPDNLLADTLGKDSLWTVPTAVLIGIPLYSNAAGILLIVSVLTDKGVALGTVLAFMMSVVALSLPELIILRRVMKPRLIAAFIAIVACGIMLTGYLFNAIL